MVTAVNTLLIDLSEKNSRVNKKYAPNGVKCDVTWDCPVFAISLISLSVKFRDGHLSLGSSSSKKLFKEFKYFTKFFAVFSPNTIFFPFKINQT